MLRVSTVFDELKYVGDELGVSRDVLKEVSEVLTKLDRVSRLRSSRVVTLNILTRKTVTASLVGKSLLTQDLLLANFYNVFWGFITDKDAPNVCTKGGSIVTILTSADFTGDYTRIAVGSGTTSEKFDDYKLASQTKELDTSLSVGKDASKSRLTASACTDVDVQEVGLFTEFSDTDGYYYDFLLTRKVASYSSGSAINIYIDFLKPWLLNVAVIWYGVLLEKNVEGVVDEGGNSFTIRTAGHFNASGAKVTLSSETVSWEPSLYNLPNAITPDQDHFLLAGRKYSLLIYNAYRTPSSNEEYNSIGLKQSLYDSGGNEHDTYIAILPLDEPIPFKASVFNLLQIRFVAL